MSAGICIMNKNAIALAADSAVTIGDHVAIHNSANKLFALSKVEPVGMIIYANSNFMQVPMEIIIKQYKQEHGLDSFKILKDYTFSFIKYIENNSKLFHLSLNEADYVLGFVDQIIADLGEEYRCQLRDKFNEVLRELKENEIKELIERAFVNFMEDLDAYKVKLSRSFSKYIEKRYKNTICNRIKSQLDWLSDKQANLLTGTVIRLFDYDYFENDYVGVLIAGYGKDEIFPSFQHIQLGGFINTKLRYKVLEETVVDENKPAAMRPVAQTDVMDTFLLGINGDVLGNLVDCIPDELERRIDALDPKRVSQGTKDLIKNELRDAVSNVLKKSVQEATRECLEPIFCSVATLPIAELAMLAESLINITSLKRKVALDRNIGTVGGPIDVAIITKADGLIWLKRKHYFDINKNLQFLQNHYGCSLYEVKNNER